MFATVAEQRAFGAAIDSAVGRPGDPGAPTLERARLVAEARERARDMESEYFHTVRLGETILSFGAWLRRELGVPPLPCDLDELASESEYLLARDLASLVDRRRPAIQFISHRHALALQQRARRDVVPARRPARREPGRAPRRRVPRLARVAVARAGPDGDGPGDPAPVAAAGAHVALLSRDGARNRGGAVVS
jgi:hypothetical protein